MVFYANRMADKTFIFFVNDHNKHTHTQNKKSLSIPFIFIRVYQLYLQSKSKAF